MAAEWKRQLDDLNVSIQKLGFDRKIWKNGFSFSAVMKRAIMVETSSKAIWACIVKN